ncbi:VTCN1 inhibitor, partial [Polypterus senegalus]
MRIYWQINAHIVVHMYNKGEDEVHHQDEKYKGRTMLFVDQLEKGNYSLQITNITLADRAEYTCLCNEHLELSKVKLQPVGLLPADPQPGSFIKVLVASLFGAVVLLTILGLVVKCKCLPKKGGQRDIPAELLLDHMTCPQGVELSLVCQVPNKEVHHLQWKALLFHLLTTRMSPRPHSLTHLIKFVPPMPAWPCACSSVPVSGQLSSIVRLEEGFSKVRSDWMTPEVFREGELKGAAALEERCVQTGYGTWMSVNCNVT